MKKILLALFLFLYPSFLAADEPGILSLMYHRVGEGKYPSTNVSVEMFNQHLQLIEESKLPFIDANEFKEMILNGKPLNQRKILLTVDDAFQSFYQNAWPVLKEKKIPFILFVNTREVSQNHPNYMNWNQVRELQKLTF